MSKRERDAEEIKRRKFARLRFQNVVRCVALNRIWLVDTADQKLSLNVKKNIALLVRTQQKIGLLTMAEKSSIRSHHTLRTVEDRKKLVSLMAGLTCFDKIPPKVRARLSKCVKFMVIGPGRNLIKEGDSPLMIYFVLTGEVEVSKKVYDHIKCKWVNRIEFIRGPGDCLGDVEMIERCTRRHTFTTRNVVELLVVFEEDFECLLRPVMEQQWMEKKCALMALGYFNFFKSDQIINACKLCMLRQFEPLETIYYEDKGQLGYVYFVISGECMILQCLKMMVSQKRGHKSFELTGITKEDPASSVFQDLTNIEILKFSKEEINSHNKFIFDIDKLVASEEDINQTAKNLDLRNMDIKSIEMKCGLRENISVSDLNSTSNIKNSDQSKTLEKNVRNNPIKNSPNFEQENVDNKQMISTSNKALPIAEAGEGGAVLSSEPEGKERKRTHKKHLKTTDLEDVPEEDIADGKTRSVKLEKIYFSHQKVLISSGRTMEVIEKRDLGTVSSRSTLQSLREKIRQSLRGTIRGDDNDDIPPLKLPFGKLENHFIDVGSLTFGSIFGLGEKLEHRVIMARTTVQCLMMPRFWLFEKDQNPGNIWQRRRFYLDSTIPSRQILFRDFLTTRQWQKFKKDIVQSHMNPYSISNPTRIEDVPIICRIVETSEE